MLKRPCVCLHAVKQFIVSLKTHCVRHSTQRVWNRLLAVPSQSAGTDRMQLLQLQGERAVDARWIGLK